MGDESMAVNKGGRPKKTIDKEMFEKLCEMQCTKEEICDVIKCDEKTLTRWCKDTYKEGFSEVYIKEASKGKMSLRRMQWATASKGNVTMQIWLGKQYLNQREPDTVNKITFDDEDVTPTFSDIINRERANEANT
jgi:hypothetical protein